MKGLTVEQFAEDVSIMLKDIADATHFLAGSVVGLNKQIEGILVFNKTTLDLSTYLVEQIKIINYHGMLNTSLILVIAIYLLYKSYKNKKG